MHYDGVFRGPCHGQRQRARGRALAARGVDVVLYECRNAVQGAADLALPAFGVQSAGGLDPVRAGRQYCVQFGTFVVGLSYAA